MKKWFGLIEQNSSSEQDSSNKEEISKEQVRSRKQNSYRKQDITHKQVRSRKQDTSRKQDSSINIKNIDPDCLMEKFPEFWYMITVIYHLKIWKKKM